jgi:phosphatidylserine/phosphatidylglycerophosphate/cardiolipin synthase-like enzyme
MHNKFIIVDANSTNNSWVMGGSTNWTNPTNLFNDYNNIIFIQDEAIAKAYTLEFEEMWAGTFGANKMDNTPHKFVVDGKNVEVYFSPSDQTTSHILEIIDNVDYSFEFGLLGFTRDDLGLAVIAKNGEFGVNVRGIIEQENITGSEFSDLIAAGVNVKSHMGIAYAFHHKYAIADADVTASNPTVLTGSHNWSSNAENNSDENTLVIHDATIANIYLQEFTERFNELGTSGIDELIQLDITIFPNPSAGKVEVKSDVVIQQINLYAVDGKLLNTTEESVIQIKTKGIYFIKIITEKGIAVKKIVIE